MNHINLSVESNNLPSTTLKTLVVYSLGTLKSTKQDVEENLKSVAPALRAAEVTPELSRAIGGCDSE